MYQHPANAAARWFRAQLLEQRELNGRSEKAFDAMNPRRHHQCRGGSRTQYRDINRQVLAGCANCIGMPFGVNRLCSINEALPRLRVGIGKVRVAQAGEILWMARIAAVVGCVSGMGDFRHAAGVAW